MNDLTKQAIRPARIIRRSGFRPAIRPPCIKVLTKHGDLKPIYQQDINMLRFAGTIKVTAPPNMR